MFRRGAPVRWTTPDTSSCGAVSLLGFRRQLLVWLAPRRDLLGPPANPPRSR